MNFLKYILKFKNCTIQGRSAIYLYHSKRPNQRNKKCQKVESRVCHIYSILNSWYVQCPKKGWFSLLVVRGISSLDWRFALLGNLAKTGNLCNPFVPLLMAFAPYIISIESMRSLGTCSMLTGCMRVLSCSFQGSRSMVWGSISIVGLR